ncbi:hypothetical protein SAMD00023353_11200100 [Rosellinia necatrix]|uniref:Uncharacterized protein n=1 Tax=Rosellinia necatrix TaxID=77044 RepID=A0A1W2TX80_ROSNE|nr:hypothetical protein SAMD00023353_11200100 [Rosellinia necatrix]
MESLAQGNIRDFDSVAIEGRESWSPECWFTLDFPGPDSVPPKAILARSRPSNLDEELPCSPIGSRAGICRSTYCPRPKLLHLDVGPREYPNSLENLDMRGMTTEGLSALLGEQREYIKRAMDTIGATTTPPSLPSKRLSSPGKSVESVKTTEKWLSSSRGPIRDQPTRPVANSTRDDPWDIFRKFVALQRHEFPSGVEFIRKWIELLAKMEVTWKLHMPDDVLKCMLINALHPHNPSAASILRHMQIHGELNISDAYAIVKEIDTQKIGSEMFGSKTWFGWTEDYMKSGAVTARQEAISKPVSRVKPMFVRR